MASIPDRERGYSVEPDTGTVHERHQAHAPLARRTSAKGVAAYLNGREPVPCETCFPVHRGELSPAQPLVVGERGAELFIPTSDGAIIGPEAE